MRGTSAMMLITRWKNQDGLMHLPPVAVIEEHHVLKVYSKQRVQAVEVSPLVG
jgi:hypothetical protein